MELKLIITQIDVLGRKKNGQFVKILSSNICARFSILFSKIILFSTALFQESEFARFYVSKIFLAHFPFVRSFLQQCEYESFVNVIIEISVNIDIGFSSMFYLI